jgi:hypothetical protein
MDPKKSAFDLSGSSEWTNRPSLVLAATEKAGQQGPRMIRSGHRRDLAQASTALGQRRRRERAQRAAVFHRAQFVEGDLLQGRGLRAGETQLEGGALALP